MTYILSYSSLALSKIKSKTRFGGSSKYRVQGDELIEIKRSSGEPKKILQDAEKQTGNQAESQTKEKSNRTYKLNKSKVRKKCYALSRLEKSRKFLAFYTITFPAGLSDQICYKLFNTWLTRCRKSAGLNTYLWVAERQMNNTIHYHLLTNDFMPIKTVNKYMGTALSTEKEKGTGALKVVDTEKYNGVDVKRVGKKRNSIISYITKYVTKNEIEFYRLPWHSSRDVSRLFTSVNFEEEESEKYISLLPQEEDKYKFHYSDYVNVAGFKFTPDEKLYEDLNGVNESIYSEAA